MTDETAVPTHMGVNRSRSGLRTSRPHARGGEPKDQRVDLSELSRLRLSGAITFHEYNLFSKVIVDLVCYRALRTCNRIRPGPLNYFVLLNRSIVAVQKDNV